MKKLIIACILFPFLVGCGHPVTVAAIAWLTQPEKKKDTYIPVPLQVTTDTVPYAVNNQPYSEALQAVGGSAPYTWSLTGGSGPLPAGLSVIGSGTVEGTPLDAVTDYNITVRVMDSVSTVATKQLTLTLYDPLQITLAAPLPDAINGQPYGPEAVTAVGGTGNITWSVSTGTLPSGMVLATGSGQISGNPNDTANLYSFTVTVQDDAVPPQSDSANLSINLYDPLTINTATLPYAINGVLYSETLNATGGTGSYTWSQAGGSLPGGVSILASGVVEGTPSDAANLYNFTVQVDDDGSPVQTDTRGLSVELYDLLTITSSATLPTGLTGSAYSETLAVAGGDGSYTWSNPTVDLPAWLSLDTSTGELSSAAVGATGLYTFTIRVTDGASPAQTDEVVFSLPVSSEMVWEDTFDDETKIDAGASSDYIVTNGYVRLVGTSPGPGMDANYGPSNDFPSDNFGHTTWIAQTFTVASTGVLVGAEIRHDRNVNPSNIIFEIRDVVGGQPGSNVLTTVSFPSLNGWDWRGAAFTNTIDVVAGQTFALVCRGTDAGDSIASQRTTSDGEPGAYSGGAAYVSTDSGGAWNLLRGEDRDIGFRIYVAPITGYNSPGTVESVTVDATPLSEWVKVSWDADIPASTSVTVQVLYDNTGSWDPVPDGDLPGNSTGFTDPSADIDLSGLTDLLTYGLLRLTATLTTSVTETPKLLEWQVHYKP